MRKISLMFVLFLTGLSSVSAIAAEWQAKHFEYDGFDLPYQIYQPESWRRMPLVIHLHGTGEAGTDNVAQLYAGTNIGPDYFASEEIQSIQKAIVLAPQTPKEMRWASTTLAPYDFKTTPSTPSMTALLKLIDHLIETNRKIDPRRIYMTGLSRGGQGVWNAVMQRPELFAAIVPIAGSGSPADAGLLTHLPVWAFHGDSDSVTDVQYTRDMVNGIMNAGGTPSLVRYTEIEGGEHWHSWLTAYQDSQVYRWMIRHRRHCFFFCRPFHHHW